MSNLKNNPDKTENGKIFSFGVNEFNYHGGASDNTIRGANSSSSNCIGPCYPANQFILHPITLQPTTNTHSFCPIVPRKNKFGQVSWNEECKKVPSKIEETDEMKLNFVLPKLIFDPQEFLKMYYSVYALDDAVLWYSHHADVPYNTIKRIMDCALKSYGQLELGNSEPSDSMVELTKFFILNYWFDTYFKLLSPILKIKTINNMEQITLREEPKDKLYTVQQKLAVKSLIEPELTTLLLIKILKKYVQHYDEIWTIMSSHFHKLKKIAYFFIKQKLIKMLSAKK
jgi:hypothetical protein